MAIRAELGFDFVIDGESFAGDFTTTINAKKGDNQEAKDALRLRAFFLMPLNDWLAQNTTITMRRNRETLTELFAKVKPKRIEISNGREVKDMMVGIENGTGSRAGYPGSQPTGYGYYCRSNFYNNSNSSGSHQTYTAGDTIGVAYDAVGAKVWFSKNGVWSGDPLS